MNLTTYFFHNFFFKIRIRKTNPNDISRRGVLDPPSEMKMSRKCLVLDLDETLVHSSFNVSMNFSSL